MSNLMDYMTQGLCPRCKVKKHLVEITLSFKKLADRAVFECITCSACNNEEELRKNMELLGFRLTVDMRRDILSLKELKLIEKRTDSKVWKLKGGRPW